MCFPNTVSEIRLNNTALKRPRGFYQKTCIKRRQSVSMCMVQKVKVRVREDGRMDISEHQSPEIHKYFRCNIYEKKLTPMLER